MSQVKGYLIQDRKGNYLNELYIWRGHKRPEEAFVHKETKIKKILSSVQDWEFKPATLIKAVYDTRRKTVNPVSQPINIY